MTGYAVQLREVTVRFSGTTALDEVTVDFPAGGIHGLLGRNGAGKSTLLATIAALRAPTAGQVLVDGEDPFENARLMETICLIRESGDLLTSEKVRANLRYLADVRPTWDADRAAELIDVFGIDTRKRVSALSRGQQSALGAAIGLACRSPLTIFDEVYLGMDAPTRQRFYDELIADVMAHPRTVILSSHLIDEIEKLVEQVVILDRGKVLLTGDADELRSRSVTVTGPADAVAAATAGLRVVSSRDLGPTRQVTVFDDVDPDHVSAWERTGLTVGAVGLQDLFIALTSEDAR